MIDRFAQLQPDLEIAEVEKNCVVGGGGGRSRAVRARFFV